MSSPDSTRDHETGNQAESGRGTLAKLVIIAVVAALAAVLFLLFRGSNGPGAATGEIEKRLELNRTALAATENLETVEADDAWSQLHAKTPDDPSISVNLAINRVLRVDELSSRATNPSLDEAEKMAARSQLPDGIAAARKSVEDYAAVATDPVTALWLKTRIDLHEASLLPGSMTKSLRRDVYNRLSKAITGPVGKDPRGIILGGSLIHVVEQLEDPIDGLPNDLLTNAAYTVGTLSDQHADNLYFALRAARMGIATKSPKAVDYVRRASGLAKAIEPSLRRETEPIGVTPDELVKQITDLIESGEWSNAENRMLLWFNVLNSTEIVKTDRRRASPHPLDLLSFESLRKLSAEVVASDPLEGVDNKITFDAKHLETNSEVLAVETIDFDLDLDPDLITLHAGNQIQLWRNDGTGAFTSIGQLQIAIECTALAAADLFLVDSSNPSRLRADRAAADGDKPDFGAAVRHNTFLCLMVYGVGGVQVVQVDGRSTTEDASRLSVVSNATGLESVRDVVSLVAGDLEADGDLDLVISTSSDGIRLFANRGNRSFFEVGDGPSGLGLSGLAVDDPAQAMAIADLDRDLDLDVVTVHPGSGRVGMIENLLHLQFRGRYLDDLPLIKEIDSISIEDVDGNVSWDLIIGGSDASAIVYSQTADAGAWTVERVQEVDHGVTGSAIADLDNDSWMDILSPVNAAAQRSRIGPWGFSPWQTVESASSAGEFDVADLNRDGAIDVMGIDEGALHLLLNQTKDQGHHLDVRFKGIDDNASGRVNHYAIGSVLELRFGPHYRARVVNSPSTHFGLDGFDQASSVRAILPNGLTQTVRDPQVDSLVEEEQTLKGSCPYLYAWDGERFVFKTDCLWAAPLGLQVARGVVAKDRPWEYLKIDGENIRPNGDHYEFRITEELWEVAYFDKVAMSVVDHPADVEVWTNEKVGPGEIATPTIFAFSQNDLRPLQAAKDTAGRDVTAKLAARDRDFVQAFDRRLRQGLCPPHWIDLDFGEILDTSDRNSDAQVFLVLTGWILPTDTSLNIQIDQNPDLGPIEFPSVWVPDPSEPSGWREAIPYMGFPGGKTKTIVVDVSEVINQQDPRFRIRTSAQIYWDSAAVALQTEPARFLEHPLTLLGAEVTTHGFSARTRDELTHPETYDYQNASRTQRWPPLVGGLTRFGPCTELVREWDDSMVVIAGGDEIRLRFSLPTAVLPEGWKRDFVIHSIGWDKDADLNTLAGQSTLPLPYRGMTAYPTSEGADDTAREVRELNRRHLQRTQSFREFWQRGSL